MLHFAILTFLFLTLRDNAFSASNEHFALGDTT